MTIHGRNCKPFIRLQNPAYGVAYFLAQYENHALAEQDAAEDEKDAEHIAGRDVYEGGFPFAGLEKLESLPGKSGKCRETPQQASKNKEAPFVGPVSFVKDAPEKADQKGTQKVDGQCAAREQGAAETLDKEKHPMAADSAD